MLKQLFAASALLASGATMSSPAFAGGYEPVIGEMISTGFDFCPNGYLPANGQLMSIAQYSTLFSILGTTYGGDGRSNFALPNLNGRIASGHGQGPGLTPIQMGEKYGIETVTLSVSNLPGHTHQLRASTSPPTLPTFEGNSFPTFPSSVATYASGANVTVTMGDGTIASAGQSVPMENRQPYLVMNWCIALQGEYPMRP